MVNFVSVVMFVEPLRMNIQMGFIVPNPRLTRLTKPAIKEERPSLDLKVRVKRQVRKRMVASREFLLLIQGPIRFISLWMGNGYGM